MVGPKRGDVVILLERAKTGKHVKKQLAFGKNEATEKKVNSLRMCAGLAAPLLLLLLLGQELVLLHLARLAPKPHTANLEIQELAPETPRANTLDPKTNVHHASPNLQDPCCNGKP